MGKPTQLAVELKPVIQDLKRDLDITTRDVADMVHVSWETLRGYLYRGTTPTLESTYTIAAKTKRPIRISGPFGTVVVQPESEVATKAKVLPFRREGAVVTIPVVRVDARSTDKPVRKRHSRLEVSDDLLYFVVTVVLPIASLAAALVWPSW